jgi:hypothetical protein
MLVVVHATQPTLTSAASARTAGEHLLGFWRGAEVMRRRGPKANGVLGVAGGQRPEESGESGGARAADAADPDANVAGPFPLSRLRERVWVRVRHPHWKIIHVLSNRRARRS